MFGAQQWAAFLLIAALLPATKPITPETFLSVLLQAIRAHDVKQVVRLFQYPFRLNAPGLPYPIPVNSPAELTRMYDMVFNPLMRCAIETSHLPTLAAPHPAYTLAIAEGVVSLADGRVIGSHERRDENHA